jgi:hypothetical protein
MSLVSVSHALEAHGSSPSAVRTQVVYCREGDEAARRIEEWLIDEPAFGAALDDAPACEAARLGFDAWLRHIEDRVMQALSSSG